MQLQWGPGESKNLDNLVGTLSALCSAAVSIRGAVALHLTGGECRTADCCRVRERIVQDMIIWCSIYIATALIFSLIESLPSFSVSMQHVPPLHTVREDLCVSGISDQPQRWVERGAAGGRSSKHKSFKLLSYWTDALWTLNELNFIQTKHCHFELIILEQYANWTLFNWTFGQFNIERKPTEQNKKLG